MRFRQCLALTIWRYEPKVLSSFTIRAVQLHQGGAMELRTVTQYLLQTLEIGDVDDRGRVACYQLNGRDLELRMAEALVLRAVRVGLRHLIGRDGYTLNQVMSEDDINRVYEDLRKTVVALRHPSDMPEHVRDDLREQAMALLDEAINQHTHLRQLLLKRPG